MIYGIPKQNEILAQQRGEYIELTELHANGTVSIISLSMSCVGPLIRTLGVLSDEFIKNQK